jgi:hypothetical protein
MLTFNSEFFPLSASSSDLDMSCHLQLPFNSSNIDTIFWHINSLSDHPELTPLQGNIYFAHIFVLLYDAFQVNRHRGWLCFQEREDDEDISCMDIYTAITATSTVIFVRHEATKKLLACMTVKEVPGKHIQSTTMLRTSMVGSTYKCIVEFESSHACIPIHACTGWLCMEVQNKATTEGEEKGPAGMNMRIRELG